MKSQQSLPRASSDASRGLALLAVWIMAGVAVVTATPPALAQSVLPVVWTAGGLDAGTTGAGQAARMTVDAAGNVTVISGPAGGRYLAVTSYTETGLLRWRQTIAPASGTFQGDWAVAAPDGDVVAVGHPVNSSGQPTAITLVRYANDGTLRWRLDLAPMLPSVARLVIDPAGNAYLAYSAVGDGRDIVVNKYSPSGTLVWSQSLNSGFSTLDYASSLALSPDGTQVVVTGTVGATWIVAAYDVISGARRWLAMAPEGPAARDVVIDGARVYVTGQGVTGAGTPSIRYFLSVVAYDRSTGTRLWRTDSAPAGGNGAGYRIALMADGSLAAAGTTSSGGYLDWWMVALETNGARRWEVTRDRAVTGDEVPAAVLGLGDGTTVVAGTAGPVIRDALGNSYMQGVIAGYGPGATLLWEGYARLGSVWAEALPNKDVCATGGYDALVTCWDLAGATSPPAAPSNLSASLAAGAVQLAWQDNASDETALTVERSYNGGSFVLLATLAANATSYADTSFTSGTYAYRVRASNAAGNSAYSNTATITIVSGNDPPTAVMTATPTAGSAPLAVTFDGTASTDLGGFITSWIWAFGDGATGSGATTSHVYATAGSFVATLTVTDNGGLSASTSTTITVTAHQPPTAPANLTATALSGSAILLQWTNTSASQTELRVERCRGARCTNFAQVATLAGAATAFTDSGLASRTTYSYRVRAANDAGLSPYSNVASAKTTR